MAGKNIGGVGYGGGVPGKDREAEGVEEVVFNPLWCPFAVAAEGVQRREGGAAPGAANSWRPHEAISVAEA